MPLAAVPLFSATVITNPTKLSLHRVRRNPVPPSALPPAAFTAGDFSPAEASNILFAASAAAAAVAATAALTDPDRRRRQQAAAAGGGDKEAVREYFNSTGFDRWRKIYDDGDETVNRVQRDIRLGHANTVDAALRMLRDADPPLSSATVCDAGCGVGSLSIPLAREGAIVYASDISASMIAEASRLADHESTTRQGENSRFRKPTFECRDLESISGEFDIVVCLDVLIHYPQEEAEKMIAHLASLAKRRLVLSFAPRTLYFDFLKRVGELFPGPSKATRAYLHSESDVERALARVGWRVRNRGFISTQFYFAKLFEAVPATATA